MPRLAGRAGADGTGWGIVGSEAAAVGMKTSRR